MVLASRPPSTDHGSGQRRRQWQFGEFVLDGALLELRRAGQRVNATAHSISLLLYLIQQRERVVSRDELLAAVWGGVKVSEGSIRQAIWELRQLLREGSRGQELIQTTRSRGYRFVGDVVPLDCGSEPPNPRPSGRPGDGFFGRAQELARLEQDLDQAVGDGGRACLVLGEAGIGKTRLLAELRQRARALGLTYLEVTTPPHGTAPAFWIWLQLFDAALHDLSASQRAQLERQHPRAFKVFHGGDAHDPSATFVSQPSRERFLLFSELSLLLTSALAGKRGLVVFEDVHCADEPSLALLCQVVHVVPRTQLLWVAVARSFRTRDNRALAAVADAIRRSPAGARLELSRLGLADVTKLLAARSTCPISDSAAQEVFALSHGNPLFTNELARALVSDGGSAHLPQAFDQLELKAVVKARLEHLPETTVEVLRAAAVLTGELSLAELAFVLERSPAQLLDGVEQAIQAGVLAAQGELHYGFTHPIMREVSYELSSLSERAQLHRRAGLWLEQHVGDARPTRLHELAHHFLHAAPIGEAAKGTAYALRCAEQSYRATAYQDALVHYDHALACMELDASATASAKLEAALARGEALRASGADTTQVNRYFLELAERAEALGSAELFARAVLGYTGQRLHRYTPTRFVGSWSMEEVTLIDRALARVGPEPSELRALLLCSLLGSLSYTTADQRREQAALEAQRTAEALGLPHVTVRVLTTLVFCCSGPKDLAQREQQCDALIRVAAANDLAAPQAEALMTRALLKLSRGQLAEAERDCAEAAALARGLGSPDIAARSQLLKLMRAFWEGDVPAAKALTQQAFEVAPEDLRERTFYMLRTSALRLMEGGRASEPLNMQEQLLKAYPSAVGVHCALASTYASISKPELAREHFDAVAANGFAALPQDLAWHGEMVLLADCAVTLRDPQRAALVYEQLLPYGELFAFFASEVAPAGPVAYFLSGLALSMRRFGEAWRWLAVCRALNQKLGASMFSRYAQLLEAELVLAETRDRERALELARRVLAFARDRGLAWLARNAELFVARVEREPESRERRTFKSN